VPPSNQRFQTALQSSNEIAKTHSPPLSSIGFTLTFPYASFPHEEDETPHF